MALYSEEMIRKIYRAREIFLESGKTDLPEVTDVVRKEIRESWERCRNYGLNFNISSKTVLPSDQFARRLQQYEMLRKIAEPIIDNLYQFVNPSSFLFSLCDSEGYVLFLKGKKGISRMAQTQNNMVLGSCRNEFMVGTNAIGTAIYLKKPIQMIACEHYYPMNRDWVCSAAPILDKSGNLLGVLNTSGFLKNVSYHTLGLVVSAAASISQQFEMQASYNHMALLNSRLNTIVDNISTGLILINKNSDIIQINRQCCELLELDAREMTNQNIKGILGANAPTDYELKKGFTSRNISFVKQNKAFNLVMDLFPIETGEAILTLEKSEAIQDKVSNIIGSKAYFSFGDIIGESRAIKNAISLARLVADNNSNVLITGESGTGKELFAQAIHNASSRKSAPFIAINCGAIPKSLIESELFGYASHAFTGASRNGRPGKFELANKGTIFLDEIGDMPLESQVNLLRLLQSREVYRIGSNFPVQIDVRIIAATNKNLAEEIAKGNFRLDLYYRLNVFNIYIPPLRERREDIRPLIEFFALQYSRKNRNCKITLQERIIRKLEAMEWAGNVRELENNIERLIYLSSNERNLCFSGAAGLPALQPQKRKTFRKKLSSAVLYEALRETSGNINKMAALLGYSRKTIYRKFQEFDIDYATYRNS